MKTHILVILAIAGISLGYFFFTQKQAISTPEITQTAQQTNPTSIEISDPQNSGMTAEAPRYIPYSDIAFTTARHKKRVLYFHAPWCPTCRPTDAELLAKQYDIPSDVMVFKADYDSETELKKKYAITYQHTFVLVDDADNEVKKWNGGALNEIIANTQ